MDRAEKLVDRFPVAVHGTFIRFRRVRAERLVYVPAREADGNRELRAIKIRRRAGQGIQQAAVHQRLAVDLFRRHEAGYCHRCTDGVEQVTLVKPDFLVIVQVRCNRGERNRQVFDLLVADEFAHRIREEVALHDAVLGKKRKIHEAHDVPFTQAAHPFLEFVELARAVAAAHDCTDGAADYGLDFVTSFFDFTNGADVCQPAGAAAAEYQPNGLTHCSPDSSPRRGPCKARLWH